MENLPTLQLWLPLHQCSWSDPAWQRDVKRAKEQWNGQDRVWLLPWFKGPVRSWRTETGPGIYFLESALPGETFNVLDVVHVSPTGYLEWQSDLVPNEWGKRIPSGVYAARRKDDGRRVYAEWLKIAPELGQGDTAIIMSVPDPDGCGPDREMKWADKTIQLTPAAPFPASADVDSRMLTMRWTPGFRTVSPETEVKEVAGSYVFGEVPGIPGPLAVPAHGEGKPALWGKLRWPSFFETMFSWGGGADLLLSQVRMRECFGLEFKGDHKGARRDAEAYVADLVSDSWSSELAAWFLPMVSAAADDEKIFLRIGSRYDVSALRVWEALADEKVKEGLAREVPVQRVLGWDGFMWWEMYQDLVARTNIRVCPYCRKTALIGGRLDRGCTRGENPQCVKDRQNRRKATSEANRRKAASEPYKRGLKTQRAPAFSHTFTHNTP